MRRCLSCRNRFWALSNLWVLQPATTAPFPSPPPAINHALTTYSVAARPMAKLTYRDAGLDLDLYDQSLSLIGPLVKRTHTPRVMDGFGGFASLFRIDYNSRLFAKNYRDPVLASST